MADANHGASGDGHDVRVRPRRSRPLRAAVEPPAPQPEQLRLDDLVSWGLRADRYGRARLLTVYLAGPIANGTFEAATEWRTYVAERLSLCAPHIRCLDPMRGKSRPLSEESVAAGQGGGLFDAKVTVARDLWDVASCDVMLLNLLEARQPSIGSMVELGHAAAWGKFIVVVLPEGCVHDHPFVRESASAVVSSLDDAFSLLETF